MKVRAINIKWDVDYKEDLDFLPTEIEIPDDLIPEDPEDYCEEISDYISDLTGYCHKGFDLV